MQKSNIRLIDEAIDTEPVKNTFRLGWEFIILNKKFTLSAIVVLLVLTLLGSIPLVGFIFAVFSSAFILIVQIYAGRLVYETDNIKTFVDDVQNIDGQRLIEQHFAPALGAYMGWMVMALFFIGVISLLLGSANINTINNTEPAALLSTVAMPIFIVMLIFAYVQPLVQSNIVMANSFKDGFLAVFSIFSADVWRAAMQGAYLKYISVYGILVLLAMFLFTFLFSIFSAIPLLNIFILIVFIYIFSIIMTVSSVIARRIVE